MHRFPSFGEPVGDKPAGRRRIRPAALAVGAGGLALGGLYLAGLVATGDEVPAGTQVRGVDIGDLNGSQAQRRLDQQLGDSWPSSVKVRVGKRTDALDARTAGLSLDTEKTVARAMQAEADPITVIGRIFATGDRDVEPVIRVEKPKTRLVLAEKAESYNREPRNGAISFDHGKPVPVQPREGRFLDVDRALAALSSADVGRTAKPVRLPVRQSEPRIDAAEVSRAMKEFATPAMSAPVTLTTGGREIEISTATIGEHLTMKPEKGDRLTPRIDGEGLLNDPAVASPLALATDEAADAKLRLDGEQVVVASDGKPGQEVTAKGITQAVLPLLTKNGAARTGAVATEEVQPKLTRHNVAQLGIKEKLSSFTVSFKPAAYRTTNVGRAAELINGSLVMPDETWSFNRTVGERTKANGFVDGTTILNGRYVKATGGGVSAVATTVFNAIFFAGVDPVEHRAHSFYIERYPEGREATVAWGSLDLRFNNDSGNAIYIQASATDTSVTITFLGTKKYDSVEAVKGPRTHVKQPGTRPGAADSCVPQAPLEGFNVEVDRVFTSDGTEVKRETFRTRYEPRDRVDCG